MKLTLILAAIVLFSLALSPAAESTWQTTPEGQMILRPFENAPYPHASREQGFKYHATTYPADPHYVDSTVGIVIPKDYQPGETVDYIVHFHGWENHVAKVIPQYELAKQLAATRLNAILLCPQGPKDAKDSGGGKLEMDKGAFEKLIKEVTAYLNAEGKIHTDKVGKIVLSTHSGGYKVTAAILDHGGMASHITDVLLLDSSYGSLEWFTNWASTPDHRMISLFTDHLADTNEGEFMIGLTKVGVKYQVLQEGSATDEELARRMVTFIHVKGPHDEIPNQYFGRLLKGTELRKIEK